MTWCSKTVPLETDCESLIPSPASLTVMLFFLAPPTSVKTPCLIYLEVPMLPFLMPLLVFLIKAKGYLHPQTYYSVLNRVFKWILCCENGLLRDFVNSKCRKCFLTVSMAFNPWEMKSKTTFSDTCRNWVSVYVYTRQMNCSEAWRIFEDPVLQDIELC